MTNDKLLHLTAGFACGADCALCMKTPLAIFAVCLLVACASAPVVQPVHEDGTEVGAATAKVSVLRWIGVAILRLIENTKINVDVKVDETD
jgi:hypothetical protein